MNIMKSIKYITFLVIFGMGLNSCTKDLEKLNENPNGADPNTTNPNLVLSTVLTRTAQAYVGLGYGDIAGVVQHTQLMDGVVVIMNMIGVEAIAGQVIMISFVTINSCMIRLLPWIMNYTRVSAGYEEYGIWNDH